MYQKHLSNLRISPFWLKRGPRKPVAFIRVTLDNFLQCMNSPDDLITSPKWTALEDLEGNSLYLRRDLEHIPNISRTFFFKMVHIGGRFWKYGNLKNLAIPTKKETFESLWKWLEVLLNSPGGIRTCDQSINSRSLYRWATEEYKMNLAL